MPAVYVGTGALGRVLLGEADGPGAALRSREGLLDAADELLRGLALVPLDDGILAMSSVLAPAA